MERWIDISELSSNTKRPPETPLPVQKHNMIMGDILRKRVEAWRQKISRSKAREPSPIASPRMPSGTAGSLAISDSFSIVERRPYESIRGQEWKITQARRQGDLRNSHVRTRRQSSEITDSTVDITVNRSRGPPLTKSALEDWTDALFYEQLRSPSAGISSNTRNGHKRGSQGSPGDERSAKRARISQAGTGASARQEGSSKESDEHDG